MATIAPILGFFGCASPEQKKAKFLASGKQLLGKKEFQRAILQFKNAIQIDGADPEAHFELSQAYLGAGEVDLGVAELYRATDLAPEHSRAQLNLAELLAGASDQDLVKDAFQRASAVAGLSPNDADALTILALTQMRLGQTEEAEKNTRKALENAPSHLKSSMLLVGLNLAKGDLAGAERALKDAVNSAPNAADPLLALGRLYRATGRFSEAEAQFQRAVQLDATNGAALVDLAAMQAANGNKQLADATYRQAAALPDRKFRAVHVLFLLTGNQPDAAVAELRNLLQKEPDDREIRDLLLRVYAATGKTREASELLSRELAKNPRDVDALVHRASIRIAAGELDAAQEDLTPVLNLKPDLGEAHYLLAKLHQARNQTPMYKQELEEAVRRDPQHLRARLELVSLLISSNAAQSALELINATPAGQRRNTLVMAQRTGALMATAHWDEAEKELEANLRFRRDPELLIQFSLVKLQRKDVAAGRRLLEEALERNPENLRALALLVSTYRAQGKVGPAIGPVESLAAKHPESSVLLQYLGGLYAESGQPDRARTAFLRAKANNPKNAGIDLNLAQLDFEQGRLTDARESLKKLLQANSGNLGASMLLAGVEDRSDHPQAAIELYRRVLDRSGGNIAALNNLANLLVKEAKWDEALGYAQQARELAPSDPVVEDTLGWAYYAKGMYPTALKHLQSAASKAPTARTTYHLAMAYLKMGDRQRGGEALERALKMNATLPEAQIAQQLLADVLAQGSRGANR